MRRKYSQREAAKLDKRVTELVQALESQRKNWSQDYFGGTEIVNATWDATDSIPVAVRTARRLNHAVVVVGNETGTLRFIALPHPKVSA